MESRTLPYPVKRMKKKSTRIVRFLVAVTLLTGPAFADAGESVSPEVAANVHKLLKTGECMNCDLRGAQLVRANLAGARLAGANLQDADLKLANLSGATLTGANLSGAHFGGADLYMADLTGATLTGTVLTGTYRKGAKIDRLYVDRRLQEAGEDGSESDVVLPPLAGDGKAEGQPGMAAKAQAPAATQVKPLELKEKAPDRLASPLPKTEKDKAPKRSLWGRMGDFVSDLNPFGNRAQKKKEEPWQALKPVRGVPPAPTAEKEKETAAQPAVMAQTAPAAPEKMAATAPATPAVAAAEKVSPTPAPQAVIQETKTATPPPKASVPSREKAAAPAPTPAAAPEKTAAPVTRAPAGLPDKSKTPPTADDAATGKSPSMFGRITGKVGGFFSRLFLNKKEKVKTQLPAADNSATSSGATATGGKAAKDTSVRIQGLKQVESKMDPATLPQAKTTGKEKPAVASGAASRRAKQVRPLPPVDKRVSLQQLLKTKKCVQCDLRHLDLAGAALAEADLERADLAGVSLAGADLRESNLKGVVLRDADLRDARLQNADLYKADLAGADLTGANLQGATLDSAVMDGTRGADLTGAVLTP